MLLEREDCLEQLDAALGEASHGDARIVLVTGEAGIGKTSLVERFVELRKRGCATLWGRCDSLFTPQPLGPLYEMAAQLPGQSGEVLRTTPDRLTLFSEFLRVLESGALPTIAVFEDVHWADAATLDLLKYVGRRLRGVRALVILTYRDDVVDREHPLWSLLGNLPSNGLRRMPLWPLSEAAVATLAGPRRPSREVHTLSGGNPFYVTELLASSGHALPATIREATLARAFGLSAEARAVIDLCAVVPGHTQLWLLQATVSPSAETFDECVRTGLLVVQPDSVKFRHELARQAVESALPPAGAAALHARIAGLLVARQAGSVPLAQIVHHAAKAGDGKMVRRYAPAAALQAAALGAHREAAAHYGTAVRHADPADNAERASLFENHAYELYVIGQIEAALEARNAALEIRRQQQDRVREGDDLRWLSRLNWFLGRHEDAMRDAMEAIDVLDALPPGPELAMALSNRSQLHMLENDNRQAIEWGNRALALSDRLSLADVRIHALNNVGVAQVQSGDRAGWANLEQSLASALERDMHEHACRAYTNLAWQAMVCRDYARAGRYLDAGLAYAEDRELGAWFEYMLGTRARIHFEQGRWQEAAIDAEEVLRVARVAVQRITPLLVIGLLRLRRGDPGGEALLQQACSEALRTGAPMRIGPAQAALAEAAWLAERNDECRRQAEIGHDWALRKGDSRLAAQLAFWLWRAGGTPDKGGKDSPYSLQIGGKWSSAAAEWQRLGCPYEEALALADGDSFARLRALALLDQLGAARAATLLRRSLRAQGVRRIPRGARPSTKRNPAGLTPREMDILRLVADGLTDRRIAEHLSISAKTVGHHVSSVLAKLDVGSRELAAAQAVARGLIAQDGEDQPPR